MSNSVSPWIKAFLEAILKYNVPRHYLEGAQSEGSSQSSKREKPPTPVKRVEKAVQIVKYIHDLKALVVSDTEHTIPVYLTNSCVLELEANGVRAQDLRTSIIVLQDYYFTTSIQATGNIEMEQLRKYCKELSFPCSMICNQFLLAASDLQIIKNPTDINLEKSLFANMVPFELYLKLSLKQFGVTFGYIPHLGDDFPPIKRFDQPLTDQDVENLPFIISRSSLTKKTQEETLGEENEENMLTTQTQGEENTWEHFHSQYLTLHTQTASQHEDDELLRAAMDSDDDDIHSTGGLRFEVESDEELASEHSADFLNTQVMNGATQHSQIDERNQAELLANDIALTQFSESSGSVGPGEPVSFSEKTVENRDSELQSQYTYESLDGHLVKGEKEGAHTQQETFSYVEATPAEVVIINDNTTNNQIKFRKRKDKKREYKKPTAVFDPMNTIAQYESSDEEKEEEQDAHTNFTSKENDPQSEALLIHEIQIAVSSSKEEEGCSLIGKIVTKLLSTDLRRPQHKTLIRGEVLGFTNPFYHIKFENGIEQQLLHHELLALIENDELPTEIQRLPEDVGTPIKLDSRPAQDIHHASNLRCTTDDLLSSQLTPISKDKEEGDRSALNISKVTMDLSDDMDHVLTQAQVIEELPDPLKQQFVQLQSPKKTNKKRKKSVVTEEVVSIDLTKDKPSPPSTRTMHSTSYAVNLSQTNIPASTTNTVVAKFELRKKSIESLLKRSEARTISTRTVIEMLKERKSRIVKRFEEEKVVQASPSSIKSAVLVVPEIPRLSSSKIEDTVPAVQPLSDSESIATHPMQSVTSEKSHSTPKKDEFRSILQATSLRKSGHKQESTKSTNMQKLISTFLTRFKRKADVTEQENKKDNSFHEEDLRWLHSYADYRKQKRQRLE